MHRGEHLFWKAKYLHLTAAASNVDQQKAQVPSETTKSLSLCRNPCPVYRGWQTKRSKNNHDEKPNPDLIECVQNHSEHFLFSSF